MLVDKKSKKKAKSEAIQFKDHSKLNLVALTVQQDVDKMEYVDVQIVVYDVITGNLVEDAEIIVYPGKRECVALFIQPSVTGISNSEGQFIIYNVLNTGENSIQVHKPNVYYYYCS